MSRFPVLPPIEIRQDELRRHEEQLATVKEEIAQQYSDYKKLVRLRRSNLQRGKHRALLYVFCLYLFHT